MLGNVTIDNRFVGLCHMKSGDWKLKHAAHAHRGKRFKAKVFTFSKLLSLNQREEILRYVATRKWADYSIMVEIRSVNEVRWFRGYVYYATHERGIIIFYRKMNKKGV